MLPYALAGVFGAALWGREAVATGNMLENAILGGSRAGLRVQGVLNLLMSCEWALRHSRGMLGW